MLHSGSELKTTKTPHEYIREILPFRYQECISCGNRTDLTCIRCGYCYSCHWKKEQVEAIELRDNLKDLYVSLSKNNNDDDNQKPKLEQYLDQGLKNGDHWMC